MIFSSTIFLFGFLPIFLLCLGISLRAGATTRHIVIAGFSIAFYAFGAGAYTLVLLFVVVADYYLGQAIWQRRSRVLLGVAVAVNLIPLVVLKYGNFLTENLNSVFFEPIFSEDIPLLGLLLPAGISFFTFQGMSYVIDVYRKDVEPSQSLLDFTTYLTMFPQLVAGPIVRYAQIAEEMRVPKLTLAQFNAGIFFFGLGMARKTLIADPLGVQVDHIYDLPAEAVTTGIAWIGAACYSIQIFYDFAGYSEMAIGLGLMMGFSFPENFRQPYRSQNVTEFWRRWHITLSSWFRDYLYIPMGGNREGQAATLRNLWVVFLLCGLWHGAAWTFVVWGAYHGMLLVSERVLRRSFGFQGAGLPGIATTLLLVVIGWVIFRSESIDQAVSMLSKMAFLDTGGANLFDANFYLTPHVILLLGLGFVLAVLPFDRLEFRGRIVAGEYTMSAALAGLVMLFLSVGELAANGFNPFIYFQF